MTKKTFLSIIVAVSFAALAGPVLATDIIPCAVGNKWEYDSYKVFRGDVKFQGKSMGSSNDSSFGSAVYEVTGMDTKSAQPVYSYYESTRTTPCSGGDENAEKVELTVVNDKAGQLVFTTNTENSGENKSDKESYDPPLLYYSSKAASGEQWTVGTMRDGDTRVPLTARAVGKETVTVPAGTFKDCLKVVYSSDDISGTIDMWEKQFTITSGKSRGVYWIADGVGVVKELEISTSSAETKGPDGSPITVNAATCTVSELKPGYAVKR